MKYFFYILTLTFLLSSCSYHNTNIVDDVFEDTFEENANNEYGIKDFCPIIGFWHSSPYIASGYSDIYSFSEDGTFIFTKSEMDMSSSDLAFSGSWQQIESDIILTITNKIVNVGGIPFPAFASIVSDYELIGGRIEYISLSKENFETKILEINCLSNEPITEPTTTLFINGHQFWNLDHRPETIDWYISKKYSNDTFIDDNKYYIESSSILGEFIKWEDERFYTSFNRLLDNNQTFLSYFDKDIGLIPIDTYNLLGTELIFPFNVLLLAERDMTLHPSYFIPWGLERSTTRERLLQANHDNLVTEV